MRQDGTDRDRAQRENAAAKEDKTAWDINRTYAHIAQALARGYTDLFHVNMDTGAFVEYRTDDDLGVLCESRRGPDFFASCAREAKLYVHPEDQAAFVAAMNRDFLAAALDRSRVFEMTYRRITDGRAFYVHMKVSRMADDGRFIVIAVSDIDELMRQRRAEARMQEERIVYARLHALTGNFIVVYVVDPETDHYREFSSTDDYVDSFAQATEGEGFFDVYTSMDGPVIARIAVPEPGEGYDPMAWQNCSGLISPEALHDGVHAFFFRYHGRKKVQMKELWFRRNT